MRKEGKKDLFDISSLKELLVALLIGGGIIVSLSISPALLAAAIPISFFTGNKNDNRKFQKTFSYLKSKKFIKVVKNKNGVNISLTKKGKSIATRHYTSLSIKKIKKPKKWDGNWYILTFDISGNERIKRDALRYLIKKFGMHLLQKSVWVYPFNCREQVNSLKDFLGLDDEVRLIISKDIGDDGKLRKIFKL